LNGAARLAPQTAIGDVEVLAALEFPTTDNPTVIRRATSLAVDRITGFAHLAPFSAPIDAIMGVQERSTAVRTTVTLDDDLLAKATKMMGGLDSSAVLREGLKALIERESAMRLAKLGGTQPQLKPVPRRRAAGAT
jgi:Arc/MetJ family transcription regulator